jgi:hypothetical protein
MFRFFRKEERPVDVVRILQRHTPQQLKLIPEHPVPEPNFDCEDPLFSTIFPFKLR